MININYIDKYLRIYKCNYKKNIKCKKTHCQYIDGKLGCTNTIEWKYAKKTLLNYIKKILNLVRDKKIR